jgi:hypothetical protein
MQGAAMIQAVRLGFVIGLLFLLSACASSHMTKVPPDQFITEPTSGRALIHFMRPSSLGGAIQSTLYDGEEYIGTVSANTRVAYLAEPGHHMFMIVGESADFMQAELTAGKVYYALVAPRMGVWKARFSLNPVKATESQEKIKKWMNGTNQVSVNEKGLQWARNHKSDVLKMKERYLPKWMAKSDADKQILDASDGR